MLRKSLIAAAIVMMSSVSALAFEGDLLINGSDITFGHESFLEGYQNRVYANVTNGSNKDLLGVVRFFANDSQIGGDQAISVFAGKTDGVFIDWTPNKGNQTLTVRLYPWEPEIDNPGNNSISKTVTVMGDLDRDRIPDINDDDIDNDGVKNEEDAFPRLPSESVDTDGDGVGNNKDEDDDNDGVPDDKDDLPLDASESIDTDKDGIGNLADTDDDNDSLTDIEEDKIGTDPLNVDTDGDGVDDNLDAFPTDADESVDTDGDGIGNNGDTDDDNDGLLDGEDEFPLNKAPVIMLDESFGTVNFLDEKTLDASTSFDEDGEIVNYEWEVNGERFEGNAVKYVFDEKGVSEVRLTVTDDSGQSLSESFSVNVLNIRHYKLLVSSLITILLAIGFYLKYISGAKKSE